MKRLLLALIRATARTSLPPVPPAAGFIPTCSGRMPGGRWEEIRGVKGGFLALRRILKCQPFHKQVSIEYDPVP